METLQGKRIQKPQGKLREAPDLRVEEVNYLLKRKLASTWKRNQLEAKTQRRKGPDLWKTGQFNPKTSSGGLLCSLFSPFAIPHPTLAHFQRLRQDLLGLGGKRVQLLQWMISLATGISGGMGGGTIPKPGIMGLIGGIPVISPRVGSKSKRERSVRQTAASRVPPAAAQEHQLKSQAGCATVKSKVQDPTRIPRLWTQGGEAIWQPKSSCTFYIWETGWKTRKNLENLFTELQWMDLWLGLIGNSSWCGSANSDQPPASSLHTVFLNLGALTCLARGN